MEKKISVVVPTHQRPDLLKKCIDALSNQEFPLIDFEIIVVSDGPDHKTSVELNGLRSFHHPFIQYITLPFNQGPAAARNAGWKAANSKLIAFTDDDCLPTPNWLKSLWKMYAQLEKPDYISFAGKVIVPLSEAPTDYELNTSHLQTAEFITANCACTKKAMEITGGFDEKFKIAWREDSDLEFRLLEKSVAIIKVEEAVVVHPVRKVPWGISIKEQKKTKYDALLYKKIS